MIKMNSNRKHFIIIYIYEGKNQIIFVTIVKKTTSPWSTLHFKRYMLRSVANLRYFGSKDLIIIQKYWQISSWQNIMHSITFFTGYIYIYVDQSINSLVSGKDWQILSEAKQTFCKFIYITIKSCNIHTIYKGFGIHE